jgi:hypothetical protein
MIFSYRSAIVSPNLILVLVDDLTFLTAFQPYFSG